MIVTIFLILAILKLAGAVNISWALVCAPLMVGAAIWVALLVLYAAASIWSD